MDEVKRRARVWGANTVLIEKAASGISLLQMLRKETNLPLIGVPPEGDKITRVEKVSAYIEMGRLYLPTEAPWLAEFRREILAFPNGKHDDQVDALAHFLIWAIHRDHDRPPRAYVIGGDTGVRDHYCERTGIRTF
jgi:predicted phage terminase large subunit-like protein